MASLVYSAFRPILSRRYRVGMLSNLQEEVLILAASPSLPSMRDITKKLHISPPAATVMVRGLVKAGGLKRKLDRHDHRITRLKITSRGLKILEDNHKAGAKRWKNLSEGLEQKDKEDLERILRKIVSIDPGIEAF